jgi:hypothetical protein
MDGIAVRDPGLLEITQSLDLQPIFSVKDLNKGRFIYMCWSINQKTFSQPALHVLVSFQKLISGYT